MRGLAIIALFGLVACELPPPDPEAVARLFEDRARAAQGPTGRVSVGANSNSGPFTTAEVGISSDFILGRDPNQVYAECVQRRTGQAPVRAPNLR